MSSLPTPHMKYLSFHFAGANRKAVQSYVCTVCTFRRTHFLISVRAIVSSSHDVYWKGKGKGKAVPLQARNGPEGSRKLRFPDFMRTTQDGGKAVSLTHRPPLPQ